MDIRSIEPLQPRDQCRGTWPTSNHKPLSKEPDGSSEQATRTQTAGKDTFLSFICILPFARGDLCVKYIPCALKWYGCLAFSNIHRVVCFWNFSNDSSHLQRSWNSYGRWILTGMNSTGKTKPSTKWSRRDSTKRLQSAAYTNNSAWLLVSGMSGRLWHSRHCGRAAAFAQPIIWRMELDSDVGLCFEVHFKRSALCCGRFTSFPYSPNSRGKWVPGKANSTFCKYHKRHMTGRLSLHAQARYPQGWYIRFLWNDLERTKVKAAEATPSVV